MRRSLRAATFIAQHLLKNMAGKGMLFLTESTSRSLEFGNGFAFIRRR
jgi:uncharacterized protein YaaW (UPF0174 family)